jgi:hypothetical protein
VYCSYVVPLFLSTYGIYKIQVRLFMSCSVHYAYFLYLFISAEKKQKFISFFKAGVRLHIVYIKIIFHCKIVDLRWVDILILF